MTNTPKPVFVLAFAAYGNGRPATAHNADGGCGYVQSDYPRIARHQLGFDQLAMLRLAEAQRRTLGQPPAISWCHRCFPADYEAAKQHATRPRVMGRV